MKLKVIELSKDGKIGYLKATNIFVTNKIVDNPAEAINYALPENEGKLESDLRNLHLAGDEMYAKSGVVADSAQVVEFEVVLQEVSRREGRAPHKAPAMR